MFYPNNWYYNPTYINQQAYYQMQEQIKAYENSQQHEVLEASKAFKDFLDKMQKVDNNHQPELFATCFIEMAKRFKW